MNKYFSYILFLLISIFVALLFVNDIRPLKNLQRSLDDLMCRLTSKDNVRPNVALVTIDGPAIDQYGNWPWNHDLIADLLAATAGGKPKTIVVDIELNENASQDSAGFTKILAEQLKWIENVVLPYDVALATFRSAKVSNPKPLFNNSVHVNNQLGVMNERSSLQVRKVFLPAEKLLATDPRLGFDYFMPEDDRVLRRMPMVMNYEGYYYPSLPLIAAANFLRIPIDMVEIIEGERIQLGSLVKMPVNNRSEMYIKFGGESPFPRYSASEVLGENFDFNRFKDKLIIICVDEVGATEKYSTAIRDETEGFLAKATAIENIINNNMIHYRDDLSGMQLLLLLLIGGLCAFVLPQVAILFRMIILFCAIMIFTNINYFLLSSFNMLVNTVYLNLELVLFMMAAPLLDSSLLLGQGDKIEKPKKKKPPRVAISGATALDQGQFAFRKISSSASDPENQPTGLIDVKEKADQASRRVAEEDSSETMAASQVGSEKVTDRKSIDTDDDNQELSIVSAGDDIEPEAEFNGESEKTADSGSLGATPTTGTLKNLGRYQITGTLGKGAMGHVYKGIDPAINRPVALKTIRLDFINDPEEMIELRGRLTREAQAVGKLSHPNIVTIYDVGAEGSLQYIAMECLEGRTLEEMMKKKVKFNYRIISQIIIQICSALEYAHERNIVHRDIKPANIMILNDYSVKVMDFGIARVESSSMTKTGIAMGTPNYISPEQLQGKAVDRRADIFSLGIVIYELLVGRRPFHGENITSLIYSVLHKDPEKPSNIKPQIPLLFDHIVDRALRKDPQERYQKASELVSDLSEFVDAFASKR